MTVGTDFILNALVEEGLTHLFMVPGGLVDPFLPALARHAKLQPIIATHEGGYSNAYVPFCGLAVIEEFAGIKTSVIDPYLEELMQMGGQELQPHQAAAVDAAAALVRDIPRGS